MQGRLIRWFAAALWLATRASPRPAPVHNPNAKGLGGGSATLPGHSRPMQEMPGRQPLAELASPPSWEAFYENYMRPNVPVVFRGAATGIKAYKDWSDEYLARRWGSKSVQAEVHKSEVRGGPTKTMRLAKFVKEIYKPQNKDSYYAVIGFEDDPEWMKDVNLLEFANCKEIYPQSMTLWFSAGGTRSVLHHDDAENFLMLLDGRKEIMLVHQDHASNLYAPQAAIGGTSGVHHDYVDMELFPRFANVTWTGGTLEKGDILYIPFGYWHQVNSFGRNLAVNVWWGHTEDYLYYDSRRRLIDYGRPGVPLFDEVKAKLAASAACTRYPSGTDFSATTMTNEEIWKEYLKTQADTVRDKKQPSNPRNLIRKLIRRNDEGEL